METAYVCVLVCKRMSVFVLFEELKCSSEDFF
jgi:hypothetical protein